MVKLQKGGRGAMTSGMSYEEGESGPAGVESVKRQKTVEFTNMYERGALYRFSFFENFTVLNPIFFCNGSP